MSNQSAPVEALDSAHRQPAPPVAATAAEDPTVIGKSLGQLALRELPAGSRSPARGPPRWGWDFHNGAGRSDPGRVHDAGGGRLHRCRSALHKSGGI